MKVGAPSTYALGVDLQRRLPRGATLPAVSLAQNDCQSVIVGRMNNPLQDATDNTRSFTFCGSEKPGLLVYYGYPPSHETQVR